MRQYAPYPQILKDLVDNLKLANRPGWTFKLDDIERDHADVHQGAAGGLTLIGRTGTSRRQEGGGWSYNEQGRLVRDPSGGWYSYEGAMDAYHPEVARPVYFYFPVPAATYDKRSWRRWIFECIQKVDLHELMEEFMIGDERPFAPNHGPGRDPYSIFEYATDEDRRTSFMGITKESLTECRPDLMAQVMDELHKAL